MLSPLAVSLSSRFNSRSLKDAWIDCKLAIFSLGRVLPDSIGKRTAKGADSVPWGVAIGAGTLVAYYLTPPADGPAFNQKTPSGASELPKFLNLHRRGAVMQNRPKNRTRRRGILRINRGIRDL